MVNDKKSPEMTGGDPEKIGRRKALEKAITYSLAIGAAAEGLRFAGRSYEKTFQTRLPGVPDTTLTKSLIEEVRGFLNRDCPNIVLLSVDTWRRDYATPEFMPDFCEWVEKNDLTRFTKTFSNSTWTAPSHATMLTGLLPNEHGLENIQYKIGNRFSDSFLNKSGRVRMIAEKLRSKGYETAAFVAGGLVGSWYRFDRGFNTFIEDYGEDNDSFMEAEQCILNHKSYRPLFLFAHTYKIHIGSAVDSTPGIYAERVRAFDNKLVKILDKILESPLSGNLKIIITSDHGEGFGEKYDNLYGQKFVSKFHGDWPCPSQIEIPLFVYDSEISFRKSNKLVGLDDVAPTIEFWAGIGPRKGTLLDEAEREYVRSETIAYSAEVNEVLRRGNRMRERGVVVIGRDEEYMTHVEKPGMPLKKHEFPDDVRHKLEQLGYLNK